MQILKKMRANERKITQAAKDFTKINWPKGFSEGMGNGDLHEICQSLWGS